MYRDTCSIELKATAAGRYISVRTFRRDGSSTACPVWVAVGDRGVLFRTFADTAKARRLRGDASVEIAACDRKGRPAGEYRPGVARRLRGHAAAQAWWRLLRRQGVVLIFADLVYRLRLGPIVYYAVEPVYPSGPAR
ncbi:MAG TPA: PPOX class F420-dependent oxidoreductase [Microlunatus sp.]